MSSDQPSQPTEQIPMPSLDEIADALGIKDVSLITTQEQVIMSPSGKYYPVYPLLVTAMLKLFQLSAVHNANILQLAEALRNFNASLVHPDNHKN